MKKIKFLSDFHIGCNLKKSKKILDKILKSGNFVIVSDVFNNPIFTINKNGK